ncbi:MAG: hypothetical protein IH891_06865 [Planctomycetes bacterium]|nr:hypothetical protein [Planctomycetota bacterium]
MRSERVVGRNVNVTVDLQHKIMQDDVQHPITGIPPCAVLGSAEIRLI